MRGSFFIALGALVALVACSAPSVDGSQLLGGPLPNRADESDDDTDAGTKAPAPTPTKTAVVASVVDAGPAPVASKACTISNAALCFTFEGNATDQASGAVEPSVVTNITYVVGHENDAAKFTTGSAMQFAPNAAFELPAGAGTIEAWINRQDTGGDAVVFDDDGRFSLTILANGKVECKSSGGAVTGTSIVQANLWQHVACVVEGNTLTAYLNGNAENSGPGSIGSAPQLAASIGANSPPGSLEGDQDFIGLIDSFRLLSVSRSATDIAADAAASH